MTARIGLMWPQTGGVWTAGNLYFENLLRSLEYADESSNVTIIEPEGGSFTKSNGAGAFPVVGYPADAAPSSRIGIALRLLKRQLSLPNRAMNSAVRRAGIDVAFGEVDLRAKFPVPWVGWIPDFQHIHHPEFFTAEGLRERDDIYGRLAERATLVLLSSEDALADFARFAPEQARKGRVAPFVSLFPAEMLDRDPFEIVEKYGIDAPFVVVPNQWWRHKNHETALRAAALLKDQGSPVKWVFTGALADYRDDRHVSRLLQLASQLGLREHIVILGALPRDEQVQLMRAADCIVQPSRFEGWSTVVEDAKTLGQRIVVSDIAVHREQAPPASVFFDPSSPEDLAEKTMQLISGSCSRIDERVALAESAERARRFGRRFADICAEAAG